MAQLKLGIVGQSSLGKDDLSSKTETMFLQSLVRVLTSVLQQLPTMSQTVPSGSN